MSCNILLSGFWGWENPMIYLILLVLLVVFISAQVIMYASRILREEGIGLTQAVCNSNFGGLLKWTSTHPGRVSALILLIVLIGIIWAISAGT